MAVLRLTAVAMVAGLGAASTLLEPDVTWVLGLGGAALVSSVVLLPRASGAA